ncbi:MAG: hypothetical protein HY664_02840 [Chloroflexi bacterium]|nr:hypothetical protein [Chloroflexota bacterium]
MSKAGRVGAGPQEKKLPPVGLVGTLALGLAIAGVIYLTSYLPKEPSFTPAIGFLVAAAAAVMVNAIALARVQGFAWRIFFVVGGWTLLGYGLISGLLMFIFIHNNLPTRQLAFQIATLFVLAVDVPMMLAFSVARYQQ